MHVSDRATIKCISVIVVSLFQILENLSCLDLFCQYEKYYCLVLKFLIILKFRKRATIFKMIIGLF